jgi:hypothetical protein
MVYEMDRQYLMYRKLKYVYRITYIQAYNYSDNKSVKSKLGPNRFKSDLSACKFCFHVPPKQVELKGETINYTKEVRTDAISSWAYWLKKAVRDILSYIDVGAPIALGVITSFQTYLSCIVCLFLTLICAAVCILTM